MNGSRLLGLLGLLCFCLLYASGGGSAFAQTFPPPPSETLARWDARRDFSPTRNPNGVWSYGYQRLPHGVVELYPLPLAPSSLLTGWCYKQGIGASSTVALLRAGTEIAYSSMPAGLPGEP